MILYLLPAIQIILLLSNFILLHKSKGGDVKLNNIALFCRMLLSFSLVISAFVIYTYDRGTCRVYSRWILFGMLFSFIGDLAMANLILAKNSFAAGMLFFMAAHCFYITAYVQTLKFYNSFPEISIYIAPVIYEAVIAFLWYLFIRNHEKGILLNLMSLIYSLTIGMMASFAFALALALGGMWWCTAFGALLFVSSDFIIGITGIGTKKVKYTDIIVWLTYAVGQACIIYSPWLGSFLK